MDDFEKKCSFKRLSCCNHEKKILHCCKKEKKMLQSHFIIKIYHMARVCSRYNARSDWLIVTEL